MKSRYQFLLFVAALLAQSPCLASPLTAEVVLKQSNLASFDPSTFGPGPTFDAYHVIFNNPNNVDIDGIDILLEGPFLNYSLTPVFYKADADLLTLGPNIIADSFFVLPVDLWYINPPELPNSMHISMQGLSDVLESNSSAVLAVLSVPTGTILDLTTFSAAVYSSHTDEYYDVIFVPEASSCTIILC